MRKWLFWCGPVAAVCYVATVIAGGLLWPGYDHIAQAISELSSPGAPTRAALAAPFTIYNVVALLFGLGVLGLVRRVGPRRRAGIAGAELLILVGLAGLLMGPFAMDPRGAAATIGGTIHLVLAGIASLGTIGLTVLLGLWFTARPAWRGYGRYTLISAAIIFVSGGLAAYAAAAGSPIMGLAERVTIGTYIVWLFVMGVALGRTEKGVATWTGSPS